MDKNSKFISYLIVFAALCSFFYTFYKSVIEKDIEISNPEFFTEE